jgi:hypothetical protein
MSTARTAAPPTLRRLSTVQPAQVEVDPGGNPVRLDDRPVDQIRERWVVEEGWWTDAPVRRGYVELVLADGGLAVVFEDLAGGGWHRHASPPRPRRGRRGR